MGWRRVRSFWTERSVETSLGGEDFFCALAEVLGALGVFEPVFQVLGEFGGVLDLDGGVFVEEEFDGFGEVLGVGAKAGGLGEGGGFDHVGAAEVDEGAADEGEGGEGVELFEFAEGVEDEDGGRRKDKG